MTTPNWETEQEEQLQQPVQPTEYHIKAHLVLEGSDKHEWGVVKDCHGCVNYIPPDADVVGTWAKYGEGEYWVSITTPVEALVDRAIQLFEELAKERRAQVIPTVSVKSRTPRKAVQEKVVEDSPAVSTLQELKRNLLGGVNE